MFGKITIAIVLFIVFVAIAAYFLMRTEKFENPPTMSYYYLPNCGWCKKFTPIWESFDKEVTKNHMPVILRKVDGSKEENSKELEAKNITGFPHVELEAGGKSVVFDGERTVADLMEFLKKNL